jgi:hypothetical protein
MTEKDWMLRILFLETVAGVPGMVGGMLRHLRSLRKLEKEGRWIETLLEEAENERMHLMTFMVIKKPGFWMRLMIVGSQGVFCNAFFFAYLLYAPSPPPPYLIPLQFCLTVRLKFSSYVSSICRVSRGRGSHHLLSLYRRLQGWPSPRMVLKGL